MAEINFEHFLAIDIRAGTIVRAEAFPKHTSQPLNFGSISALKLARKNHRRKLPIIMIVIS